MFVEHAPVQAEPFEPAEPVALAAVPDLEPVDLHVVAPFHDEPSEPVVAEHEPIESLPVDEPSFDAVSAEVDPVAIAAGAYAVSELTGRPARRGRHARGRRVRAAGDRAGCRRVRRRRAAAVEPVAPARRVRRAGRRVAVEPRPPPNTSSRVAEYAARCRRARGLGRNARSRSRPSRGSPLPSFRPRPTRPVVIHPPVAAADLPPIADAAAKGGPFWKKELSFSRKPKAPKEPKVPKAERAPKTKSASTPFWKKQIGRKPAAAAAAVAVVADAPVEAAVVAAAPKVPFWKKQVSLGRKKTVPAEVAVAAATAELPAGKPVPFWKKLSFSMPALALPTRSSGGGKKGGHAVKKLVGLKIGSSQLAAARVSNNGVAEVQQLAREVLAPGIVVGGELRDPDALGEALKGFFARNKLPKKGVRLGIASNRIGVRIFDIVGVTEDKQLANAIHFRAQETLPIPLDEAVLDYRVLDESVDAEGQPVKRVLLVVVYRELVERYVAACKKAGIQLAGIDLEAFALLRTLAPPVDRGSSALVGVAIGYDRSTFAVSDGRVCEFTRVLEWGGSALNVALARTFDSTPSEVEAIKRSLSLDESTVPPGLTTEQAAQAVDAVRRQVQSFARELVSSLQFYQNQPGSLGIGEIVLTGGTTHLPGLAAELERLIGVHVRVGDPFARVKISKRLEGTEQSGSLAVAIGLGIED